MEPYLRSYNNDLQQFVDDNNEKLKKHYEKMKEIEKREKELNYQHLYRNYNQNAESNINYNSGIPNSYSFNTNKLEEAQRRLYTEPKDNQYTYEIDSKISNVFNPMPEENYSYENVYKRNKFQTQQRQEEDNQLYSRSSFGKQDDIVNPSSGENGNKNGIPQNHTNSSKKNLNQTGASPNYNIYDTNISQPKSIKQLNENLSSSSSGIQNFSEPTKKVDSNKLNYDLDYNKYKYGDNNKINLTDVQQDMLHQSDSKQNSLSCSGNYSNKLEDKKNDLDSYKYQNVFQHNESNNDEINRNPTANFNATSQTKEKDLNSDINALSSLPETLKVDQGIKSEGQTKTNFARDGSNRLSDEEEYHNHQSARSDEEQGIYGQTENINSNHENQIPTVNKNQKNNMEKQVTLESFMKKKNPGNYRKKYNGRVDAVSLRQQYELYWKKRKNNKIPKQKKPIQNFDRTYTEEDKFKMIKMKFIGDPIRHYYKA